MEEHQKSNKNVTENSNFLTPLFGSIQNQEKTEPDKLSYSWRTPKFETMQCSKILVPSISLHFLPNQTRPFSLVRYWVECQPSTWSYHSYSWQDTAQMDCFSRNLRVGWIKQYAKKPRNQKMHARIFVIIKNEKERREKWSLYDCMDVRGIKLETPILPVVFNGHAFIWHQVEALVESLIFCGSDWCKSRLRIFVKPPHLRRWWEFSIYNHLQNITNQIISNWLQKKWKVGNNIKLITKE